MHVRCPRTYAASLMSMFERLACTLLLALPGMASADTDAYRLPPVEVTPTAYGGGLPAARIPGNVQTVTDEDIEGPMTSVADALEENVAGIALSNAQNNPLQPELSYRGFSISPLLGLPQGIAVYQAGARINEPFGDTINFDLLPLFAVERVQVLPGSNPLYGLNALGGAISLDMKSGFTAAGTEVEALAGSFGRRQLTAEHGAHHENLGLYVGATHFREDGWRDHSASEQAQLYLALDRRGKRFDAGMNLTLADSDLNGNGAAPAELLAADREAVFTWPDNTANEMAFLQLHGKFRMNNRWALQSTAYVRRLERKTVNGDESDIEECENAPFLCLDRDVVATDIRGNDIPATGIGEPFGLYGRSSTQTTGHGLAVHAERSGGEHRFLVGVSYDAARTDFSNTAELGELTTDRTVTPRGVFLGGDAFNTALDADNRYLGLFGMALFALASDLDLVLSGRFNRADIELDDRRGDALDGEHAFDRFNPALGVTWRFTESSHAFASYSESNRAPTPAELSCADPSQPCRFPHAFVADPPLAQVVARTFETGLRGGIASWRWSGAAFVTVNDDDIQFVSSGPVIGSGYFRNVGETRRRGIEASVSWRNESLDWFAKYAFVEATFRDPLVIRAEHNPSADADGEIRVQSGDRLPGIPAHSLKLGVDAELAPRWRAGLRANLVSDRVLRGDESNQQPRLDGFAVLDAHLAWQATDALEIFLLVENLLDAEYETFGTFGEADELPLRELDEPAENPRFLGPAPPFGAWLGVRLSL